VVNPEAEKQLLFKAREFKGSRFRCLLSTSLPPPTYLKWINSLVGAFAEVGKEDRFMPQGFAEPDEAKLGETSTFLGEAKRKVLTNWWLAVPGRANTPNWDFVSTCTIKGKQGLILVEAKAHVGELKTDDRCTSSNQKNRDRIVDAIGQANAALGEGWSLSADRQYQLSNRFAWSWKLASLGVPVVFVYLGFLNAYEMPDPFRNHRAWEDCLRKYAVRVVPERAWNSTTVVDGTSMTPLIRSTDVNIAAVV